MIDSYYFSKEIKNTYISKLKRQMTIRLDEDTIGYFKSMSEDS